MKFPPITEVGFSSLLYLLLAYILYLGIDVFVKLRLKNKPNAGNPSRIIYLGAAAAVIGIVAFIQKYREAMEVLVEVTDISPSFVAGAISDATSYPTLGFSCLAISFLLRFIR
jgi:hypothetical protein